MKRAVVAAFLLLAAPAHALSQGQLALVDRPTGLDLPFDGSGSAEVTSRAVSADGHFVVFASTADDLVATDDNRARNSFRLDRQTGEIVQVNTSSAGVPGNSDSREATISADGRYVAFESTASNLDPAKTDALQMEVYVKDLSTGTLTLASRNTGSGGAVGDYSQEPVISGDGRHVIFLSQGLTDDQGINDSVSHTNVFERDLTNDKTYLVGQTASHGAPSGGAASGPVSISYDGSAAAFTTTSQLAANDVDTSQDVYYRHLITSESDNIQRVAPGSDATLSTDGTEIAYRTTDAHVDYTQVPGLHTLHQADIPLAGGTDAGNNYDPAFSSDASGSAPASLTWLSTSALDPADGSDTDMDLYRVLLDSGPVHRISSGDDPAVSIDAVAASGTGDVTAFSASSSSILPDRDPRLSQVWTINGGQAKMISGPGGKADQLNTSGYQEQSPSHSISDDGRLVLFESEAPALTGDSKGSVLEAFIRDTTANTTTPVSVSSSGALADGTVSGAEMSADGTRVVFVAEASNLGATAGLDHVYLHDLVTGKTTLIDHAADGTPGDANVGGVSISDDGTRVAYITSASNVPGSPGDSKPHPYIADVTGAGTTRLDTGLAHAHASSVALDGDGGRAIFSASDLTTVHEYDQAYVHDVAAGTTTWVSQPATGTADDVYTNGAVISRDGTHVAFGESGTKFGFGATASGEVFVRDLAAATPVLVSVDPAGSVAPAAFGPSISADGHLVAFSIPDDFPHEARRYAGYRSAAGFVRNLTTGTTAALPGSSAVADGYAAALNASGACVTLTSYATDLVTPSYGPDDDHLFEYALGGDCPVVPATPGGGGQTPGGGQPGGGGGTTSADTTPPTITKAKLSHKTFVVSAKKTATTAAAKKKKTPQGTTFTFTLSETATVTIAITQKQAGRKSGSKCVKPRKGLKKKCTRVVTLLTLTRKALKAGVQKIAFSGRTSKTKLKPGKYTATLTATDAAKNHSKPTALAFTVVRR